MRVAFGKTIVRLAERDDRIVLLTGDVVQEMGEFRERWPDRFYNLGITEKSIIGVAAGLANEGMRPVVYSLTPFVLERPFSRTPSTCRRRRQQCRRAPPRHRQRVVA